MSLGFCYLAEVPDSGPLLSDLERSISVTGAQLANPWNGKITRIDDEGEQTEITRGDLELALEGWPAVTFQFWLSDDTDLTCSFRRLSRDLYVHAYGLNGLDQAERDRVTKWVLRRFEILATDRRAALLVVDEHGATADYDWDLFLEGRLMYPAVMPELVFVAKSFLKGRLQMRGQSAPSGLEGVPPLDGYVLLRKSLAE